MEQFQREATLQAQHMQDRLLQMNLPEVELYYREKLQQHGTNVEQNDQDMQGDGDQSRVSSRNAQFYRDMFACGGDINHHLEKASFTNLSDMAVSCIFGSVKEVEKKLQEAANEEGESAVTRLLETRETSLRLSPLLMMVSISKNFDLDGQALRENQVKVVKVLLKYGARPDARDVCGKTVCHYGMGVMATHYTMQMVNCCIQAHESSHFFGKQVEMYGLNAAHLNGSVGLCGGYDVDKDRRSVCLTESNQTVAIKPQNLRLVETTHNNVTRTKLCDIPDRYGSVCLLEVVQSDRTDVGEALLKTHKASLDIADCDGVTPRSFSLKTGFVSKVAAMVNKTSGARALKTCSNCGALSSDDKKLLACGRCGTVQYCGKECQVKHWKEAHKAECKKVRAQQRGGGIMLEKPAGGGYFSTISFTSGRSTAGQREGDGYRKPSSVAVGEKFFIKVQGGGPTMPLMIYDKSRECNFGLNPGDVGFDDLRQAVNREPAWQGRKTFVAACFDAEGNCTVYPGENTIKKW